MSKHDALSDPLGITRLMMVVEALEDHMRVRKSHLADVPGSESVDEAITELARLRSQNAEMKTRHKEVLQRLDGVIARLEKASAYE